MGQRELLKQFIGSVGINMAQIRIKDGNGNWVDAGIAANNPDDISTDSDHNTKIGDSTTLASLTTGGANVAVGYNALNDATTAVANVAVGAGSLALLVDGLSNTAVGINSFSGKTEGDNGVAIGIGAGDGDVTGNSSIYIGRLTSPNADGEENQIVIGHTATGNGSNTATIGNEDVESLHVGTKRVAFAADLGVVLADIAMTGRVGQTSTADETGDMLASEYDPAGVPGQVAFVADLGTAAAADVGDFAPALGADDNYVTDDQIAALGAANYPSAENPVATMYDIPSVSGTNTGDQIADGITITGAGTVIDPFVATTGGTGDMLASAYDPAGVPGQVAFAADLGSAAAADIGTAPGTVMAGDTAIPSLSGVAMLAGSVFTSGSLNGMTPVITSGQMALNSSEASLTLTANVTLSGTPAMPNANTTGSAGSVKSNATTGVLQVVGPATGTTRVMTVPDADFSAATLGANTFTGDQNLADHLLTRSVLKDTGETINAIGAIGGGTQDIDLTAGNVVTGTVDTSETTFTFSNPSATGVACGFVLKLTNGGSQTVNWPASVDFVGGTAPVLTASGVDVLVFTTVDEGTTWLCFVAGLDVKSPA